MIKKKKAYLICPVRNLTKRQRRAIDEKVKKIKEKFEVYVPYLHANQEDPVGDRTCNNNLNAIRNCDAVFVWWDETSSGSLFDFGLCFALNRPIYLLNRVKRTPKKSFNNVLNNIARKRLWR